jgi:hypothetical protein
MNKMVSCALLAGRKGSLRAILEYRIADLGGLQVGLEPTTHPPSSPKTEVCRPRKRGSKTMSQVRQGRESSIEIELFCESIAALKLRRGIPWRQGLKRPMRSVNGVEQEEGNEFQDPGLSTS